MRSFIFVILLIAIIPTTARSEIYVSNVGAYIHPITHKRVEFPISSIETQEIKQALSASQKLMQAFYSFPEIDITVKPCGETNAYSMVDDGDIVMCSELLYAAEQSDNKGLLFGTLFHEMGHSLLNLWGLPNYDNEKTVDEFATVFLIMTMKNEYVNEWISFFENRNPYEETKALLEHSGQHPLSFQRISAIKKIQANPVPVIQRWNNVLYPHMHSNALRGIINNPNYILGSDPELAQEILNSRN